MLPQRYPQLLCAPGAFEPGIARSDDESLDQRADIAVAGLTMPQRAGRICIESEWGSRSSWFPNHGAVCARRGDDPLSEPVAF
jgi:hypothetical protein